MHTKKLAKVIANVALAVRLRLVALRLRVAERHVKHKRRHVRA